MDDDVTKSSSGAGVRDRTVDMNLGNDVERGGADERADPLC